VSLQRIPLDAPAGADQITLRLTHAATNPGVVSGSFDFLAGGSVVSTQSFSATGSIFNGENWTRAQIIAFAPGVSDASLAGTYGALTLNQAGEWTYELNNDSPAVQALNASDTVTDTFSVRVLDTDGAFDIQTLTINVTGANDLLAT
jgi:VCBS repeat-containing protein